MATDLLSVLVALTIGIVAGTIIRLQAERSRSIHGGNAVPGRLVLQLLSAITAVIITTTVFNSAEKLVAVIAHLAFGLTLVGISTIDWCQQRIPTIAIRPAFLACAILLTLTSLTGETGSLPLAALGAAGFYGLLRLVHQIQPGGMGMGDVRLAALLGLFIGWASEDGPNVGQRVGMTLFIASILGLVLALSTQHQIDRKEPLGRLQKVQIPFGPALSLAAGLVVYGPA